MSKKKETQLELDLGEQLDCLKRHDTLPDEVNEAINIFKDPPDNSEIVTEQRKPIFADEFISSSKILRQISGEKSGLGFAFELEVFSGEAIIDDLLDPSDFDNWLSSYWTGNMIIFDSKATEPFNEKSKEILNVKEHRNLEEIPDWVNLVCHRDNFHQTSEHEYRANVKILDRYFDRNHQSKKISHNLFLNDKPALIEVIIEIKAGGVSIQRTWNEVIDENRVEIKLVIGSDFKYNQKLCFAEAFQEFKTKKYRIESKKYFSIEMSMKGPQCMCVPSFGYTGINNIDFIKYGKEIITHIAIPIFNNASKFNYKMIPYQVGSDLKKKSLYHLTGSIINQIKFQQNYWDINDAYIEMLQEDDDPYYADFGLFKPENGKSMERYFPMVSETIDECISSVGRFQDKPRVSINYWIGSPVFQGIKTNKR